MADMVRFGLKNVHYSKYTPGSGDAAGTYATPVPMPGAVQMTTSPEGDSSTFYADDRAFYVVETNNGYSGTIQVAAVADQFLTDVLGYETDATSGLTYETTDVQPASVALLFEIDGNVEKQRFCLYNVTFSRMESEANTKADSTDPDTVTLNFTAIGRTFTIGEEDKNVVKAVCSNSGSDHDAYDAFFTKVVIPGTPVVTG